MKPLRSGVLILLSFSKAWLVLNRHSRIKYMDQLWTEKFINMSLQSEIGNPLYEELTTSNIKCQQINSIEPLFDNRNSFRLRHQWLKEAKKEILMATYGLNNDMTGQKIVNQLIQKRKEGLTVKFICDCTVIKKNIFKSSDYHSFLSHIFQNRIALKKWLTVG